MALLAPQAFSCCIGTEVEFLRTLASSPNHGPTTASKKPAAAQPTPTSTLKKPAAAGGNGGRLSSTSFAAHEKASAGLQNNLDDKLVEFQKKPYDITGPPAKMWQQEREAVWTCFDSASQGDPVGSKAYKQVATGPGSRATKDKLLDAFIKNKCSFKGRHTWHVFSSKAHPSHRLGKRAGGPISTWLTIIGKYLTSLMFRLCVLWLIIAGVETVFLSALL